MIDERKLVEVIQHVQAVQMRLAVEVDRPEVERLANYSWDCLQFALVLVGRAAKGEPAVPANN